MIPKPIDIIIPTYDNINQLQQAINSIRATAGIQTRFIVVNNNQAIPLHRILQDQTDIYVLSSEYNMGWTGGLAKGMTMSKSDFVVFANDDIFVPLSENGWLLRMVKYLGWNTKVGAIGPSSNCVMGVQNIWANSNSHYSESSFLIGFCMVVRRVALDEAGGINLKRNHGDDIDLSIRLRSKGYGLVVDKGVFVFHHGFQTGNRLYGGPDKPGGWNSKSNTDTLNMELIREHGFLEWWHTMSGRAMPQLGEQFYPPDQEGNMIRSSINGCEKHRIIDLGCGDNITIDGSIGMDKKVDGVDLNDGIPTASDSFEVVIARHLIEHLVDPLHFLGEIYRVLDEGGTTFITTPDEEKCSSISLDPTHLHVFTKDSLTRLALAVGFTNIETKDAVDGVSFLVTMKKEV